MHPDPATLEFFAETLTAIMAASFFGAAIAVAVFELLRQHRNRAARLRARIVWGRR